MKIYQWSSQALRDYGLGQIVALGEDAEDARRNAMIQFDANYPTSVFASGRTLRKDILNDLARDPMDDGLGFFISGSS